MIARLLRSLGAIVLSFFTYLGELVMLASDTFRSTFTHKLRWKLFGRNAPGSPAEKTVTANRRGL